MASRSQDPQAAVAPWDLIVKTLGAIAAGIGILGFVTLAGGVILFERLAGAHIPPEDAVAVVPRTELLTIGASQLLPLACLVGLIALLLWVALEVSPETSRWIDESAERHRVWAIAAAAAVGGVIYFAATADHFPGILNLGYLVIAVFGGAVLGVLVWDKLADLVADRTMTRQARFGWFTILVAILIPLEGAMIGWVQSRETPLVKPAVLFDRTTHLIVRGFFIAASGDHVYIGETDRGSDPHVSIHGRVLDIPREEVARLSVGNNLPVDKARARWQEMAREVEATLPPGQTYDIAP